MQNILSINTTISVPQTSVERKSLKRLAFEVCSLEERVAVASLLEVSYPLKRNEESRSTSTIRELRYAKNALTLGVEVADDSLAKSIVPSTNEREGMSRVVVLKKDKPEAKETEGRAIFDSRVGKTSTAGE